MADDKVVDLTGRPVNITPEEEILIELREAAIAQLEDLIDDFRAGKMNGFAMVFSLSNGGGGSVMSAEVEDAPVTYPGQRRAPEAPHPADYGLQRRTGR